MSEDAEQDQIAPLLGLGTVSVGLVVGALGVVFGDIGTSPLYAFRIALAATGSAAPGPSEVLGILSLVFWALMLIVSAKYAAFVLRADNNGEGGVLALMTLAREGASGKLALFFVLAGLAGAALFLGDAIITPAISVLSAVEGLEVTVPALSHLVVPVTIGILLGLFAIQSFGTGRVAAIFGPITLIWFLALAGFGILNISAAAYVVWALDPQHAIYFLVHHFAVAAGVVGAVFLVLTGAEALYSDLGHFGKKPILWAWFGIVMPCLMLNYLGQGAFVLEHGFHDGNIFYLMVPDWARPFMLGLAAAATVIASQAVISGIFSLMSQATQLHFLPRFEVRHTSETQSGQIYLPLVNVLLLIAVLVLVVSFKASDNLAAAYGISVNGVMLITSALLYFVMTKRWAWPVPVAGAIVAVLFFVEAMFMVANLAKIADGGWVPVVVALGSGAVMFIWMRGRQQLLKDARKSQIEMTELMASLKKRKLPTVPGMAVFLTTEPDMVPSALAHSLKHYNVLHERNIILSVTTADRPHVPSSERITVSPWDERFTKVVLTYGFMDSPNVPRSLPMLRKFDIDFDSMTTSYFLSRRTLVPKAKSGPARWRARLYIALSRNATDTTRYFHLPVGRVVEIGTQITMG